MNSQHSDQVKEILKRRTNKLTPEQVLEIRASDKNQSQLAKDYGVHVDTIHKIILRKSWKHV